jgi:hypothetical protein
LGFAGGKINIQFMPPIDPRLQVALVSAPPQLQQSPALLRSRRRCQQRCPGQTALATMQYQRRFDLHWAIFHFPSPFYLFHPTAYLFHPTAWISEWPQPWLQYGCQTR